MTRTVLLHAPADAARAASLAEVLTSEGIVVELAGLGAIGKADCRMLVWSQAAVLSEGVTHALARALDTLLIVRLDGAAIPAALDGAPVFDLARWRGGGSAAAVKALVSGCRTRSALATAKKRRRRWLYWLPLPSFTAVAALVGFNLFSVQDPICAAVPQPFVSDACGAMGLGDRPKRTERIAWEARRPGNCADLRAHIQRFSPDGKYVPAAHALTEKPVLRSTGRWRADSFNLPLYETIGASSSATEAGARADTLARATMQGERLCRGQTDNNGQRFVRAVPIEARWSCERFSSGHGCSFEGRVRCEIQAPVIEEFCPGG